MNKPLTYYNDIEHFPCEVLRKNIKLGLLPEGYVDERDIREIQSTDLIQYRHIHLFAGIGCFPLGLFRAGYPLELRTLTAGFPCQDLSSAGRQAGIIEGEKSSLWKEIVRLLHECNTAGVIFDYILIENVRNLLSGGDWQEEETPEQQKAEAQYQDAAIRSTDSRAVDEATDEDVFRTWMGVVLADLADAGYDAEWTVLSASDFGAPHQRKRIFIVAYPNQIRKPRQEKSFTNGQRSKIEPTSVCRWEDTASMADLSGVRSNPRRTQSKGQQGETYVNSDGPSVPMANTSEQGLQERGNAGFSTNGQESSRGMDTQSERCSVVADTSSSGQQECNVTPITEGTGHYAWRKIAPGIRPVESSTGRREWQYQTARGESGAQSLTLQPSAGQSQSVLGGNFDGSSNWLDRYRWPAGPGEQQYPWEPPRTIKGKDRVARLQALGNAIVVPCTEYIGRRIIAHEIMKCGGVA